MRNRPPRQRTYTNDTDFSPRGGAPFRKGNPRGCPRAATHKR